MRLIHRGRGSGPATASAVGLAALLAAGLAGCGGTAVTVGTTTTTAPATPATAAASTTTTSATPVNLPCSAAGLPATVAAQPGLPAEVAAMRDAIAAAAVRCDYATLARLGDEHGAGLRTSFGEPGDPVVEWRQAEQHAAADAARGPMYYLRRVLDLPYARSQPGSPAVIYVWPSIARDTGPTEADLQTVASAGLYPLTELRTWAQSGGYLGYRALIGADGDWQSFVTGD